MRLPLKAKSITELKRLIAEQKINNCRIERRSGDVFLIVEDFKE